MLSPVERPVPWKEFLELHPPSNKAVLVCNVEDITASLALPTLTLYCSSETCSAKMLFDSKSDRSNFKDGALNFLVYRCKHCQNEIKIFAVLFGKKETEKNRFVTKIGEHPAFGSPISAKLLRLLGDDKNLMLQGRQAENQGLGIGSFSYYRRIIENRWKTLLGKIIDIVKIVDPTNANMIAELEALQKQKQFSQAINSVAPAIPQALLIDGQNPLLLLHKALSIGIHGLTDEQCLAYATDVRIVLSELVEKMSALKADDQNLKTSVRRLAQISN